MNRIVAMHKAANRLRAAVRVDVGIDPVTKWDERGDAEQALEAAALLPDEPVSWRDRDGYSVAVLGHWRVTLLLSTRHAAPITAVWEYRALGGAWVNLWSQDCPGALIAAKAACEPVLRLLAAATEASR